MPYDIPVHSYISRLLLEESIGDTTWRDEIIDPDGVRWGCFSFQDSYNPAHIENPVRFFAAFCLDDYLARTAYRRLKQSLPQTPEGKNDWKAVAELAEKHNPPTIIRLVAVPVPVVESNGEEPNVMVPRIRVTKPGQSDTYLDPEMPALITVRPLTNSDLHLTYLGLGMLHIALTKAGLI